jgi:hypothetical protein
MGKFGVWSRDKRALSPIFATVLLATIIIVFGSVAYYYSSNITQAATNNYINVLSDSQQSIAERVSFENVVFNNTDSPYPTLTIYILNSGSANNIVTNTIFLYDVNHQIIGGSPYSILPNTHSTAVTAADSSFIKLNDSTSIKPLNVDQEGVFAIQLDKLAPLTSLPAGYTIHLITKSGSAFDYAP